MASGDLRDRGLQVFPISTRSGEGLQELIYAMARLITARRDRRTATSTGTDRHSAQADR